MDTASPENKFKYMFFNRIPILADNNWAAYFLQYHTYLPNSEDSENYIDQNSWNNAIKKINEIFKAPLYPTQISSPFQLVARCSSANKVELNSIKDIEEIKQKLNENNENIEGGKNKKIIEISNKLDTIKSKQISVISKLEKLAILKGRGEYNHQLESIIHNKLKITQDILQSDFRNQVNELKSKSQYIFQDNTKKEEDIIKLSNSDRLGRSITLMKDMKKIFDATYLNICQNKTVLETMQEDLEHLKIYGKLR